MEDMSTREYANPIANLELTETYRALELGGKPRWSIAVIRWWSLELGQVWWIFF